MKLLTRSGLDWTDKFGKAVVEALAALPVRTGADRRRAGGRERKRRLGLLGAAGRSQRRPQRPVRLLRLRSAASRRLRPARRCRWSPARRRWRSCLPAPSGAVALQRAISSEDGELVLRHACRLSLEGVVSKLRDAPYRSGRSKDWLKSKCSRPAGVRGRRLCASTTSRKAIGSLVLGYYRDGELVHAGRRRHRLHRSRGARTSTGGSSALRSDRSPSPNALERRSRRGRCACAAGAGGRGRVPRLDGGREPAPRLVPRAARGQAGERDRAARSRASRRDRRSLKAPLDGQADPSRPDLLAGCRRHQGGPRRLLCRGLALHGAARRRPAAVAGALPERHRRGVLLPEARLEGTEPRRSDRRPDPQDAATSRPR